MTGSEAAAEGLILGRINEMIRQEEDLREQLAERVIDESTEHARLARLEVELDRCWDLLRQRKARVAAGQNPDTAHIRTASEVEDYLS
ncbi:DUF2630 family protein [Streptomyces sp. VRA16 Mangrove soil]|uniref:DUF2630 family protein n=1 Tax=Streptomyces sp. VRA16 Mangrove soil TaxID=2817434 RepID=UPI001A9DEB6E|nr:DUF2630 family protein [Streptomyces sp. VRA16 Mangrove soil]MBO1332441.1 DUF2630 family protein [Streptomyces sp. VRA16 Mangrove soil]